MTSVTSKLKNVTLKRTLTRSGDDTWMLIHDDGWRDPYFDYFAKDLLENRLNHFSTRELYCRAAAGFTDYMVEAAKWYHESGNDFEFSQNDITNHIGNLSGPALVELIRIYPKVLAGGANSSDPVVNKLSPRLNRKAVAKQSQQIHIAAVNHYLELSEGFNLRLKQSGLKEFNGLPLLTEDCLFPHLGMCLRISRFEQMALSSKSMLGGVIAGGPKLKRLAALKPVNIICDGESSYDYDSAFPIESAPDLINYGFNYYRDRTLYCLLMASGVRINEALALTWCDIDCANRKIFIRDPRKKDLEKVYLGYLTLEQRDKLPWKGRTHANTLLIEPFASEFWRLLELYMKHEMFSTSAHPFVFQVLKGHNESNPLILSDQSNLRKNFKSACRKVGVDDCYSAHSLRHMYGVYCINYWPNSDGSYGLTPEIVQYLMGHTHRDSTMNYAKPDTLILEVEQKTNAAILSGFAVEDRTIIRVKVIEQMLKRAKADVDSIEMLQGC